ncbi:MAG: hypothetical protein WD176_07415, partial [Pirellulales bacterium]
LRMGVPFALIMGALFAWKYGIPLGVPMGVASGVAFGWAMSRFTEKQRNKMECTSGLFEEEAVLFQGPANHFMNFEGRGGWLVLTPTRLAFRSHRKNAQNIPLDIGLDEVASAGACRTAGVIPNGLKVVRKSGVTDRFVVTDRKDWVEAISKAMPTKAPQTDGA